MAALGGGFMVEKIGRKKSLLIAGIFLFIPWFLIIFGTNIGTLYAARFIGGLGGGIVIVVSSNFIIILFTILSYLFIFFL